VSYTENGVEDSLLSSLSVRDIPAHYQTAI